MSTATVVGKQTEKVFRIMTERGQPLPAIPLRVIEPHQQQAARNHGGQSLLQLNNRGGLTPKEALHVLLNADYDRTDLTHLRLERMTTEECDRELRTLVRTRYRALRDAAAKAARTGPCTHPKDPPTNIALGVEKCAKCGMLIAV